MADHLELLLVERNHPGAISVAAVFDPGQSIGRGVSGRLRGVVWDAAETACAVLWEYFGARLGENAPWQDARTRS